MSPDSSPKSAKSDPIEAVKEDAETTATRKELKNTSISGIMEEERAKTPDSDSAGEKDIDLKDRVLSPKKKRARDQLEDEKALETEASDAKDGESKVDMPSPKKQKHNGQVVGAISPTALRSESWNEHLEDEAVGVHPRPAALGCGMDDPTASAQRLEPESPREAWPVAGNQMEEEEASYLEDKQDGEVSPEGVENQEGESLNAPTTERPDSIQHDANHTREKDRGSRSEPEKKRHRDELSPTSDAVAATTVPTAVHPGKKPESDAAEDLDKSTGKPTTTSGSAFAQSGFSKLSQAASPFGALGGTTAGKSTSVFGTLGSAAAGKSTSVFGGGAALASSAATKPAPSLSFKQTSGPSPFGILGGGSKLNGFGGGFGGGFPSSFASAAPSGRLSSFAKPGETFGSSTKNEKPFGAPDSDNEEDESGNEDEEDSQSEDNGKAEKDDTEKEKDDAKAEEKKKKLQMGKRHCPFPLPPLLFPSNRIPVCQQLLTELDQQQSRSTTVKMAKQPSFRYAPSCTTSTGTTRRQDGRNAVPAH